MPTCISKFTSHKVRKIRWQPISKNCFDVPNQFVTGSWDETENVISLWSFLSNRPERSAYMDPKLLHSTKHTGDVTELKFVNVETLVTGSSKGAVYVYEFRNQSLTIVHQWLAVHQFEDHENSKFPCSCTSLDTYENSIITAGEDGKVSLLNCDRLNVIRKLEATDISTINCVKFLNQFHVVTANMRGQMKLWDLRERGDAPSRKFVMVGECVGLNCLSQHPHQHQVVATGGEDGTLCIWDTRQEKYPVNVLSAHDSSMLEIKFHPHDPNHMFTCAQNGSVWHWDCSSINKNASLLTKGKSMDVIPDANPWLACSAAKHRLEICSLLPTSFLGVNSIDIEKNALLCGSDNEAFYILPNTEMTSRSFITLLLILLAISQLDAKSRTKRGICSGDTYCSDYTSSEQRFCCKRFNVCCGYVNDMATYFDQKKVLHLAICLAHTILMITTSFVVINIECVVVKKRHQSLNSRGLVMDNVSMETDEETSLISSVLSTLLPTVHNASANTSAISITDDIIIADADSISPYCNAWSPTNHIFFQLANAFLFLSYLAPNGIYGILYLRSTLMIGCFFFSLWGYAIICALDTLIWNSLFVVINFIHFCILLFYLRPVKFNKEIENLHRELFVPLKVSRQQFKKILGCIKEIRTIKHGEMYAVEKQTRVDKLSLVLSGRLVVSQCSKPLHIVGAHQFLDSPEWFGVSTDEFFQVTITALEESRIMVWNRDKLKLTINNESFLQAVFDHILGRDVVKKLMQVVNESFMTNGKLPSLADGEDQPMLIMKKHDDLVELNSLLNKQMQGYLNNKQLAKEYAEKQMSQGNDPNSWRLGNIKEEEHETAV
uniref:POPDC1-3 domain-containing protein n=1 Tax=Strigamia maritima TaxID=126957 RepID=T1JAS8_STRMM